VCAATAMSTWSAGSPNLQIYAVALATEGSTSGHNVNSRPPLRGRWRSH
jgi:hypothetical protein